VKNGPSPSEREAARAAAEVARRAIRRLDILEWVFLAGAVGLAVGGGWLVAWLVGHRDGGVFRWTWILVSLLLLLIPGAIVMTKTRRAEAPGPLARGVHREEDDG
jgi:uncharacterized membrane protein